MKLAKTALLSGLALLSWIALVGCSEEQPATGYAATEPESRGQFWVEPPWQSPNSEEPPPMHWKDFMQSKIDAWKNHAIQAAALQRLERHATATRTSDLMLHAEAQPGTFLVNVWCTGGTLSQRHECLKAAMESFVETHQFDPRWNLLKQPIADVVLTDDTIRDLRKQITSNSKKSPPDDASEMELREKLRTAKVQLQEKRKALLAAPPIKTLVRTGSIAILTPPRDLAVGH